MSSTLANFYGHCLTIVIFHRNCYIKIFIFECKWIIHIASVFSQQDIYDIGRLIWEDRYQIEYKFELTRKD